MFSLALAATKTTNIALRLINTPNIYVDSQGQHGVTFFTQRSQRIPHTPV